MAIKINRMMINICSENLNQSSDFYTKLFDFTVQYESDWFIHLLSKDKSFELGIIDVGSEIVPKDVKKLPTGTYITFVVDNVDEVYNIAQASNYEIVESPKNTFYGQRRMLLKDPNAYIIDISSLIS